MPRRPVLARCRRHPRQPWRPVSGEHRSPGRAIDGSAAPSLGRVRNRSKFRRHGPQLRRLKVTHTGPRHFARQMYCRPRPVLGILYRNANFGRKSGIQRRFVSVFLRCRDECGKFWSGVISWLAFVRNAIARAPSSDRGMYGAGMRHGSSAYCRSVVGDLPKRFVRIHR